MLETLKDFNLQEAELSVWVFKKRTSEGNPIFTGKWITVDQMLKQELIGFIDDERENYTEVVNYSLLAQNNENSLMHIGTGETSAVSVAVVSANQTPEKKVTDIKELSNCEFYSVKLVIGDVVLHCVKKTDSSWSTKKSKGFKNIIYKNNKLSIDDTPKFNISRDFYFFVLEDNVFIKNKKIFESVLSYKKSHISNFSELVGEAEFSQAFTDAEPLKKYVGNNAMQLRRASAIKQKGYYKNPDFMRSLQGNANRLRLNLQFDKNGKIIVNDECCADIFQALLDHRLQSHFAAHIYDVPNASMVS